MAYMLLYDMVYASFFCIFRKCHGDENRHGTS